jgi:hypothetical protein
MAQPGTTDEKTRKPRIHQQLRTVEDLRLAYETLYNRQAAGELDAKTSDGLNTTLKGSTYLNVKLPMEAWKLVITAQKQKAHIPEGLRKALPIVLE